MATPVIISLLIGLVAGGAFMAMWAANRIEEESVRQFDRGFERGRWLTDISVAKAIEDQDRARRVGQRLLALAVSVLFNWQLDIQDKRSLVAYDH